MKNSNDTIGNRTLDLPACRAVPQPTAPSRTPRSRGYTATKIQRFVLKLRFDLCDGIASRVQ